MENKRKLHVVITDNESGEVMLDKQSDGIIAAIEHEKGAAAFASVNLNGFEMIKLISVACGTVNEVLENCPELQNLCEAVLKLPKEDKDKNSDSK